MPGEHVQAVQEGLMVPDASQACRLLGGMALGPKSFLASWVKEHMWKSREETPNAHGLSVPQVSQPIHMSASLHYTGVYPFKESPRHFGLQETLDSCSPENTTYCPWIM